MQLTYRIDVFKSLKLQTITQFLGFFACKQIIFASYLFTFALAEGCFKTNNNYCLNFKVPVPKLLSLLL